MGNIKNEEYLGNGYLNLEKRKLFQGKSYKQLFYKLLIHTVMYERIEVKVTVYNIPERTFGLKFCVVYSISYFTLL